MREGDPEQVHRLAEFYLQRKAALVVLLAGAKALPEKWVKRRSWQVMEYRKNYITEIVTAEKTVGASVCLSASVEISTRESSRALVSLDSELLGGILDALPSEG